LLLFQLEECHPSYLVALAQFEWAWKYQVESLAIRKAVVEFKSLGGLANKMKLAYAMLILPA
nr:structure-specific endonuclease subunit SLX1 [Tanacetum cinerariifolium]